MTEECRPQPLVQPTSLEHSSNNDYGVLATEVITAPNEIPEIFESKRGPNVSDHISLLQNQDTKKSKR